ncbi:MAG: hypothetical protein AAF542_18160 [Pseudomonadota bacterium]
MNAESNGITKLHGNIRISEPKISDSELTILGSATKGLTIDNKQAAEVAFQAEARSTTIAASMDAMLSAVLYENIAESDEPQYRLRAKIDKSVQAQVDQSAIATTTETGFFNSLGQIAIDTDLDTEVIAGDLVLDDELRPANSSIQVPVIDASFHDGKLLLLVTGDSSCHNGPPQLKIFSRTTENERFFIPANTKVSLTQDRTDECLEHEYTPYYIDMAPVHDFLLVRTGNLIRSLTLADLGTWNDIPLRAFPESRAYVTASGTCLIDTNCPEIALFESNGRFFVSNTFFDAEFSGYYTLSDDGKSVIINSLLSSGVSADGGTITPNPGIAGQLSRVNIQDFRAAYPTMSVEELRTPEYSLFAESRVYHFYRETVNCNDSEPEDCTTSRDEATIIFSPDGTMRIRVPGFGISSDNEAYRVVLEDSQIRTSFFGTSVSDWDQDEDTIDTGFNGYILERQID